MDKLLHEEVVHTARVVFHFVGERGHLLRAAVVDGREVLLGVGVIVVFQFQLCVRRDDGQLLQVLYVIHVCERGRLIGGRGAGGACGVKVSIRTFVSYRSVNPSIQRGFKSHPLPQCLYWTSRGVL